MSIVNVHSFSWECNTVTDLKKHTFQSVCKTIELERPVPQALPEEVFSDDEDIDTSGTAPPLAPEVVRTKVMSLEPMSIHDAMDQVSFFFLAVSWCGHVCRPLRKRNWRSMHLGQIKRNLRRLALSQR